MVREQLNRAYPDEEAAYADVWRRIWVILSSICIARLWLQRNRVTFQQATMTIEGSVQEFWETGMRQLRAIGKRESRRADSSINGTRLLLCQRVIARQPREPSPQVTSPVQPPDLTEEPALLTRLRIYQTSCKP